MNDHVFIAGPASWNRITLLDLAPLARRLIPLARAAGRHAVAAAPANVRDTNGAGDAFMAGVLDATLSGSPLPDAMRAGARNAASVLGTRHLHPSLDAQLEV